MICVYSSRQDSESEPFLEAMFKSQQDAEQYAKGWNDVYSDGYFYFFVDRCDSRRSGTR